MDYGKEFRIRLFLSAELYLRLKNEFSDFREESWVGLGELC